MMYTIIERQSGGVVASFETQAAAFEFLRDEMEPTDEWALFEFGTLPTDNRLVGAGPGLLATARGSLSRVRALYLTAWFTEAAQVIPLTPLLRDVPRATRVPGHRHVLRSPIRWVTPSLAGPAFADGSATTQGGTSSLIFEKVAV